jgi:hypothetical protein
MIQIGKELFYFKKIKNLNELLALKGAADMKTNFSIFILFIR